MKILKSINIAVSLSINHQKLLIITFLVLESLTLSEALYFPGSPTVQRLLKLKDAKSLRTDLFKHKMYVEKFVKHLDEWAFEEIKQITNNQNINELKLNWLEKQLNGIYNDIRQLSVDVSNSDIDNGSFSIRLNIIKDRLNKLTDNFDESNRNTFRLLKEYFGNDVINLIEQHENLLYQISAVDRLIKAKYQLSITDECIDNIKNEKYEIAALKLEQIKDDRIIADIIRQVYNKTEQNFNIILEFSNKINNITQKLVVLSVIVFEMELHDHTSDGYKTIELIKYLKSEVTQKSNSRTRRESISLEVFLIKRLKNIEKESLKNTILNLGYFVDVPLYVQTILLDESIFSEVSFDVLLNFFKDENVKTVYSLIIDAFSKILDEIFIKISDNDVFKLAHFIKDILELAKAHKLTRLDIRTSESLDLNIIFNEMSKTYINRLPGSVKSVVFNQHVCIVKVGFEQYLQSNDALINMNKHNVFISRLEKNNIWKLTRSYDNVYNVQNIVQNYTYLYTNELDSTNETNSHGHYVFTVEPDRMNAYGVWEVIPVDDECYIRNVQNNEYLFTSQESNHLVFTVDRSGKNDYYFKWRIQSCSLLY